MSRPRTVLRLVCLAVWSGLALLMLPGNCSATGTEQRLRHNDLELIVDSQWAGGRSGGYYPIRIRATNFAASRTVQFRFVSLNTGSESLPTVNKTVQLEQNATAQFSLSIPLVSDGQSGRIHVYDNGRFVEELTTNQNFPDAAGRNPHTPSLLVISQHDTIGFDGYEQGLDAIMGLTGTSSHGWGGITSHDHQQVGTSMLPERWNDYSGLDLVAIPWSDFEKLTATQKQALIRWCGMGGHLMFYNTKTPGDKFAPLTRVLAGHNFPASEWIAADRVHRLSSIPVASTSSGFSSSPPGGSTVADPWEAQEPFQVRNWGLGHLSVFVDSPFPGAGEDWHWWANTFNQVRGGATSGGFQQQLWQRRNGIDSRLNNEDFLQFLIPGVGGVPVYSFLVLITLFAIVIGPLNFWLLSKRRQQYLLVFTVPCLAFVTSLVMMLYSLVSDGLSTRSRATSFTWLDPQTSSAYSLSRLSLYAPMPPSAGLKFSDQCTVLPIWSEMRGFEGGTVDLTSNDQQFQSGWLRAQTWTQFYTMDIREQRGRIQITPPAPGAETLTIANGLEHGFKILAVVTPEGQWYMGQNIPAGASAELKISDQTRVDAEYLRQVVGTEWKLPEGLEQHQLQGFAFNSRRYRSYRYGMYSGNPGALLTSSNLSLLTNRLSVAIEPQPGKMVFCGLADSNPGIQMGVPSSIESLSRHVVAGTN